MSRKVKPIALSAMPSSAKLESQLRSPHLLDLPLLPLMHGNLINVEKFSKLADVHVVLADRVCYTFRAIMEVRLPSLLSSEGLGKKKEKKGLTILEIKPNIVSYETFLLILRYAYTGEVGLASLRVRELLPLYKAALKLGAPPLALEIEQFVKSGLTVERLFETLPLASSMQLESIKVLCLQYAAANYQQVVTNKDGISKLGIELFQELTLFREGIKEDGSDRAKESEYIEAALPNNVRKDFETIYRLMNHSDGVAVLMDGEVPFHRCVLAAYSEKFYNLFMEDVDAKRGGPAQYDFSAIPCSSFQGMLEVAYFGTTHMGVRDACGLLASMVLPYDMPALRGVCEMIIQDVRPDTALEILNVTYLPVNRGSTAMTVELRQKCLDVVKEHFGEMSIECLRDMGPEMAFDLCSALHEAIQKRDGIEQMKDCDAGLLFVTSPRVQPTRSEPSGGGGATFPARGEKKKKKSKSGFLF